MENTWAPLANTALPTHTQNLHCANSALHNALYYECAMHSMDHMDHMLTTCGAYILLPCEQHMAILARKHGLRYFELLLDMAMHWCGVLADTKCTRILQTITIYSRVASNIMAH